MTEPGDPASPLDVVRARIFYLACDIEPVCPLAATLLRAAADAIDDSDVLETSEPATSNGALSRLLSQVSGAQPLGSRVPDSLPASERRLGVVSSQAGYKR